MTYCIVDACYLFLASLPCCVSLWLLCLSSSLCNDHLIGANIWRCMCKCTSYGWGTNYL